MRFAQIHAQYFESNNVTSSFNCFPAGHSSFWGSHLEEASVDLSWAQMIHLSDHFQYVELYVGRGRKKPFAGPDICGVLLTKHSLNLTCGMLGVYR